MALAFSMQAEISTTIQTEILNPKQYELQR